MADYDWSKGINDAANDRTPGPEYQSSYHYRSAYDSVTGNK